MLLRSHPRFARLWLAQVVSVIGDGMHRIALLWWARTHGGTALLVAVAACTIAPVVLASPFAGSLADRVDRRHLLVGADLWRLGTVALLAWLLGGGDPTAWL